MAISQMAKQAKSLSSSGCTLCAHNCHVLDLIGKPLLYLQMGKQSFFSPKEGTILLGIPSS